MNKRTADPVVSSFPKSWCVYCLGILLLKLLLLALDPSPKVFLGDSASYIWTALSGWIPPDRSFLYGYIVRWLAVDPHSLTPLLLCQTFLGAVTAVLVAVICRSLFSLSSYLSYFFGLLCAIDPLQLLWERYVMTEVISLFFYLGMLLLSFLYLKQRRLWQIAVIQLLGLLAISLRISYLLLVQAQAVLLPVIAFLPEIVVLLRESWSKEKSLPWLKTISLHLVLSVSLMLLLHSGYQHLNGRLSQRKPAYLYVTGINLLAMWAPALESEDSPDPRLSAIIAKGDTFAIHDPGARGVQLYWPDRLVGRWKRTEPDDELADEIAKRTALHAFYRQPFSVLLLGWETFLGYWHVQKMARQAKYELGNIRLPEALRERLTTCFNYSPPTAKVAGAQYSLLQSYFLEAQPYYNLVVLLPILCAGFFFTWRSRYVFLLLFHSSILLGSSVLFTVTATVRYLQPLSLLLILAVALFLARRGLRPGERS